MLREVLDQLPRLRDPFLERRDHLFICGPQIVGLQHVLLDQLDIGETKHAGKRICCSFCFLVSALLLPMGRLSDIIGRKQVYIAGFIVFIGGAILASASNGIMMLIFSRVIMGTGAAMTQGTGMAMVLSTFPDNERGKALGLQMSVVGVGAVAGPAFGGIIVSVFDWRGVFLITAIVSSIAVVVSQIVLDGRRPAHRDGTTRFDWWGAALSTSMLIIFLLAMSNAPTVGWGHPVIVVAFASVVALLGSFIWWELRTPSPMFDVRLFKSRLFSFSVSASFLSFLGSQSVRFLIPFYLQAVLGFGPRQVGLIIVPAAVAMIITGPIGGRLSDRYGWTKFNVGGLALMAMGGASSDHPSSRLSGVDSNPGVGYSEQRRGLVQRP